MMSYSQSFKQSMVIALSLSASPFSLCYSLLLLLHVLLLTMTTIYVSCVDQITLACLAKCVRAKVGWTYKITSLAYS